MSVRNIHRSTTTMVLADPLTNDDKIAITGIGCRYGGGVAGPRELWDMLKEKRDCTSLHPPERFDKSIFFFPGEKKKGKLYTKAGGYLKQNPEMFDRQFFKMSPDEAGHMDPQIRILLEVVWESIEDAGIPASVLRGSNTGVYMGVTANEYLHLVGFPQSNIDQYTNSGTNSCMISNRISYEFDLRGPSFSIDTACSSSLYAVQIACDALRGGLCDTAIAGGVNIILTPSVTIGFCQAGMLSPDGQCKSFDESANGYSRSEGAGSVVLKPLKRAIEDGDRIYAVIRGGALTNDGRTPGIANPSFDAQIDLVDRACAAAKVDPRDVAYIEAHGTGTPVGDKTEANAIGEAMGKQRPDDAPPLFIGSIKSNVGHSEGAAGIAGVIKTALSLYHREIPGVVHFKRGNPNINFKDLRLRVPSSSIPWPGGSKLLAGCSSFGFGGANAHVVLEAAPLKQFNSLPSMHNVTNFGDTDYHMLLLSATSKEALLQKCSDWIEFLVETLDMKPDAFLDALFTASVRSHHHIHRLSLLAKSRSELVKLLRRRIKGNLDSIQIIEGKAPEGNSIHRIVFVFSGMGTQWWGMARELMNTHPIFSNVIQKIDDILGKYGAKWSLVQILSAETGKETINDTEISQTCICSVQIGLVDLYKHYGVTPRAIIGHSVGEVAAAYAAGLLTMTAAVRIIFSRGHLLTRTSGSGTMAAVLYDVDDIQRRIKSTVTDLDVAAVNSPSQIVLSGKAESIKEFTSKLSEDGVQTKVLKVNNAFHSRQQDVLMKEFYKKTRFLGKTKSLREQRPLIPMMSTVTNRYVTPHEANGSDYWWTNIRQQVLFRDAVDALLKDGYNSFLEIGAHPVLSPAIQDIIASKQNKPTVHFITHSLKRPKDTSAAADDSLNIYISLAQMYVKGYAVDMRPAFSGHHCKVESVPLYPWQRVLCSAVTEKANTDMRYPNSCHPLLGKQELSANYAENKRLKVWKTTIGTNEEPWIGDHVVQGSIVLPAAGFIEVAIAAHHKLFKTSSQIEIYGLNFDRFLFMSATPTELETTTELETGKIARLALRSLNANDNKWMTHTTMNLIAGENEIGNSKLPVNEILNRCPGELSKSGFYANKKQVGFDLGESFMCIEKANFSRVVDEALIQIRAPDTVAAQSSRFYVHPALLDGILQGMAGIERQRMKVLNPEAKPDGRVPRSIQNIQFRKVTFPDNTLLHYTITSNGDDAAADVSVADAETHDVIGRFKQIRFGPVATSNEYDQLQLWEKTWVQIYPGDKSHDDDGPTFITGDDEELSRQLNVSLRQTGILTTPVSRGNKDLPSNIIMIFKAGNKDSLNEISKEDLLNQQSQMAMLCIDQYNAFSRNDGRRPNMWIVTRDGFPARTDDLVNPSQASAYGFGLSVMQEDPSLNIFLIDIPSDVDSLTVSKWLINYIWKTDRRDNILALRHSTDNSSRSYDAYSLRVNLSKAHEFPYKILSPNWKFDIGQSFQSGRLFLTRNHSDDDIERRSNADIAVKVGAFHLMKTTGKSSNEPQHVALFCGQCAQNKSFIGFCDEKELKSTMHCGHENIIEVTSSLCPEDIVNIVLSYLVPFGVIRNFICCKESTVVICMSSNEDKMGLAMAHMAVELGHNVVVAVKDLSVKNGVYLNSTDHQAEILDVNDVPGALKEQSVNFLIGWESTVRDLLKMSTMNEKFKPFAIIGTFQSSAFSETYSKLGGLPKNVIVENIDHEFYSNKELQQMKPILDELLQVFEMPSSVNPLKDALPEVISLENSGRNERIPFEKVTIAIAADNDDGVATSCDFLKGEIVFENDKSYLVTGGTKGFGLCLVEWLSAHGAGRVYIMSRSEAGYESEERLNNLRKSGKSIVHIKADITSKSDVEQAFKKVSIDASYTLSGIFHCAAQYDDKLLKDITPAIWKRVMAAKSWGALLLHQTSIKFNAQLKYFVMISSVVQLLGNTGQASYCAANTYLSSLGYFRRSKGLPATVFCPGVIRRDGFAARSGLVEFWEKKGIESLAPAELLNGLGVILKSNVPEMGMSGDVKILKYVRESRNLFKEHMTLKPDGRFSILKGLELGLSRQELILYVGDSQQNDIVRLKPEEARLYIFNTLCGFISQRLGITGQISPDASPSALGIDSLMTTELSGVIQGSFAVLVPPMELMNANITLQAISASIYKRILAEQQLGGQNKDEEEEEDTSWKAWFIMDESVVSPDIQLVCFPPNGGGPSTYAWWQNQFSKHNVQLIMAQLPGWEGRHQEKPLQTIEEITTNLTEHLVARLIPGRFVLFGHSLGGLISFEVAHRLIERNLRPAHIIISSWYAPTLAYPNAVELEKAPSVLRQMEQDIKNNIKLSDNKALRLSFLDDEALNNHELMKRLIPCFQVGFKICQKYTNTHTTKLQCGMTVLGAKSDRFVPPTMLDAWCLEIQPNRRFKKTLFSGGHMHITSAKKKFFQEIQTTLREAFDV
ncbi:phthiocerol/phenolphthiocerol synthesis polyketide synthase type I PpsD-like [Anneissia japonica]|uniref:phthiocerol/phenolphthiocerol synthesis polyketide synthase type I PpsD-like n=1 Tax=Anneissia japonica TaxID=1529436 RepID=UPI0014256E69|nr:phthiocerol/phenolphthiocerol synthesis polyketide synthase type I PpsD-like [Anneissia japonica]